jgi:hypothetical protein
MKIYLLLALALPSLALADWTKIPSAEFPVDPYPAARSEAYAVDFDTLHRYQTSRSQEECALSRSQLTPSFDAFFGSNWDGLTKQEQKVARPILEKVMKFTDRVTDYHKSKFKRPRPFNTDPRLNPCIDKPTGSKAYPSGHASMAAAGACVLGLIFPDKAEAIATYGDYLGELRAIVGVHHPSDVAAGQQLGRDICERLSQDREFRAELPR